MGALRRSAGTLLRRVAGVIFTGPSRRRWDGEAPAEPRVLLGRGARPEPRPPVPPPANEKDLTGAADQIRQGPHPLLADASAAAARARRPAYREPVRGEGQQPFDLHRSERT